MVPLQTSDRHPFRRRRLALLLGTALVAALDQEIKQRVLQARPDIAAVPGVFSETSTTQGGR